MFSTGSQDSRRRPEKALAAFLSFHHAPFRNSFVYNAAETHRTIPKPCRKAENTQTLRTVFRMELDNLVMIKAAQRLTNKMNVSRIFVLTNIWQMCYASEADMRLVEWRPHWSAQSTPRARTESSTVGAERSPNLRTNHLEASMSNVLDVCDADCCVCDEHNERCRLMVKASEDRPAMHLCPACYADQIWLLTSPMIHGFSHLP